MYKVLIIDDDGGVRDSLFYHFEDSGYDVSIAVSGEDAESIIAKKKFDIVIVDLRLPKQRGDDFIKSVYDTTSPTQFIMYTGSEEYSLSDELKELSRVCKRVYYKPLLDLSILNSEIETMMQEPI